LTRAGRPDDRHDVSGVRGMNRLNQWKGHAENRSDPRKSPDNGLKPRKRPRPDETPACSPDRRHGRTPGPGKGLMRPRSCSSGRIRAHCDSKTGTGLCSTFGPALALCKTLQP
jgi:hypothetical protein